MPAETDTLTSTMTVMAGALAAMDWTSAPTDTPADGDAVAMDAERDSASGVTDTFRWVTTVTVGTLGVAAKVAGSTTASTSTMTIAAAIFAIIASGEADRL